MKHLILLITLLTSITAFGQSDVRNIESKLINGMLGYRNFVQNPSCKKNTSAITASGGSLARNTSNALDGVSDCTWDPSTTGQTLTYTLDQFTYAMKGQNCEARVNYYGDASLVKAYINQNSVKITTDLQLLNGGTNGQVASISFPCGDASTTTALVLEATGNAASVQYGVYVGSSTSLLNAYNNSTEIAYTPTFSNGWGTVTSPNIKYKISNGWLTVWGTYVSGTVTANIGSMSLPTGYVIDFSKIPSTTTVGSIVRNAGSTALTNFTVMALSGSSTTDVFLGGPLGESNITSPFSRPNVSSVGGNSETYAINFSVPVTNNTLGMIYNVNSIGSYYSGYHDSTCAWARTNVSYGAFTADASCALVQRQASGIGAVATGSVLPALALTLPITGTYYICASVNSYAAGNGGLRMTDGTTVIFEANDQSTTRTTKTLCGSYVATSLTPTISIEGKSSTGAINIDTSTTTSAIEWTIFPITNNIPMPVFVGSISSAGILPFRMEYLQFGGGASGGLATSACTASPCTIAAQSSSWVSSVTRSGTGAYSVSINSGMFSAVPYCVGNAGLFGVVTGGFANVNATSTTQININAYSNAGTTLTDNVITLFCMGPR